MISNETDHRIDQLQNEITAIQRAIKRLSLLKVDMLQDVARLEAERDQLSGLKTRVIDGEIQMGVSYHGGRL
jgi:hypothetical protein